MGAYVNNAIPSALPADHPRGRTGALGRVCHVWRLEPALVEQLNGAAATLEFSTSQILFAALVTLVARYARDETVTLDLTPRSLPLVAGSDEATIPDGPVRLSIDATAEPTLYGMLARVRAATGQLTTVATASSPPEVLVDFGAAPDPGCTGEFIIAFSSDSTGVGCSIDANALLFARATLQRFALAFERLLRAAVRQPSEPLARIALVGDEDRTLLLETWNATSVPRHGPQVIHRLFEVQVDRTPDNIAAEFDGRTLTYRALNTQANALAARLVALGVKANTVVGVSFERSHELLIAILAVLKAGGAFLPLDPEMPRDRLRFMLEDVGSALVLASAPLTDQVAEITRGLPVKRWVVDPATSDADAAGAPNLADRCGPHDLAYVIYTSGSTGKPKGVLLPHRALCNHALWFTAQLGMSQSDRMLLFASIGFDAVMAELFAPLVGGATVVLAAPNAHRDILGLPGLLQRDQISVVQIVPSVLRIIASTASFAQCGALRYLVSGGEALDGRLAGEIRRALPHLRLGNFYGPTEAGIDATCHEITGAPDSLEGVPIGRPIANARCRILDPWQNLTPIGVAGELHVGGLGLANGYLNLPESTASRFIADPFAPGERLYRTGDFARYLPSGEIEYLGRIDEQVKLRGYRIEIAEVEGALLQHPEIRQAAVVLREDTPGEPQLVAYLVLAPVATVAEAEIRTLLRRALPVYMVPSAFCFLDALPLTASAKLDRSALPAPEAVLPHGVASLLLEDPLERSLQEIWERTLAVRPIGPDDDFFALGGHSLKAIRLLAEVQRVHGIELRAPVLFDAPTIRTLAVRMRDARLREVTSVIPVQPRGTRTPLFFAPGAGGELFVFDELARALGPRQPLHVLDMYVFDEGEERTRELTMMDVAARMLRDIRQVQPHGPYQLAGYSLGGNIVLEIAQQMRAAGEQVALLALLDCDGPAYPLLQPFLTRTVQHIRHAVSLGPGKTLPYLWTRFGKLSRYINGPIEEELNLYRDQDGGDLLPREMLDALERSLAPVLRAWEQYVPQFYGGAALVVRADVRLGMVGVVDDDPALGWGPIIGGGLKLERLDCNHFQLLRPEFASRLAALLQRYLASHEPSMNGNGARHEHAELIAD